MEKILIYGKEHTFLDSGTGLLFRSSSIHQTAKLHTHTFYEIFVVSQGTALHMVNHAIQTIHKGDLIFIRPADTHTYEFHCSDDFRIINVGFSKRIFQSITVFLDNYEEFQELLQSSLPAVISLPPDALKRVKQLLMALGAHINSPYTQQTVFHAKACLSSLFIDYFFHYTTNPRLIHPAPSWFTAMLEEMQKIENLQLGFARMQELSPCSVNHLCRLCKKYLSATPTQYINQRRLEYAVYLLTQTANDILSVSSLCGFNNLSHFYHLFKAAYGNSPAAFKKAGS